MSETSNEQQQAAAAAGPGAGVTANDLLAGLQRVRVRDDGSCWVYAPLAGLGVLDHAPIISSEVGVEGGEEEEEEDEEDALDTDDADAGASSEPKSKKRKGGSAKKNKAKKKTTKKAPDDGIGEPSERDRLLDYAIRNRLYEKQRERLGEDPGSVLIVPQEDSLGSYGGHEHFSCLAVELGVDIAVYDEKDTKGLRSPSKEWWLLSSSGDWMNLTASKIQERMNDPDPDSRRVPVLHVAMSRDIKRHYEAYRYKGVGLDATLSSYEFPSWFRDLEKNVADAL